MAQGPECAGDDGNDGEEREGGQHAPHEWEEQLHRQPASRSLCVTASRLAPVSSQPAQPRRQRCPRRHTVAEDPVSVYDFHATVLHLLGLDHTRLTYYHNGIQRRLTDVHGEVVQGLLA